MTDSGLWRILIPASPDNAALLEAVLEPHCETLSCYVADDGNWRVEGIATSEPDPEHLTGVLAEVGIPSPTLTVEAVEQRDWVTESLESFHPVTVGRYFIHGSHHKEPVPPGKVGLCIDAGAAFGSGEHPTTRGCLQAFEGLAHRRFHRLLDMGCGSGILSLAMARTWNAPVLAVDIDPKAVEVTRDNARLNGVGERVRAVTGSGAYDLAAVRRAGPYDLVVANILANPLCAMARGLSSSLDRGGLAVLSGFVPRDGYRVMERHRRVGLRLVRRIEIDGWLTLVLEK